MHIISSFFSEGRGLILITDIHCHVFPDRIARKAADSIGDFYGIPMCHDGTLGTMLALEDAAGIGRTCIHSVAITPHSMGSINRFIAESAKAHPDRLVGFGAIHPDCEDPEAAMEDARALGLQGFKIHPDMQLFALDEPRAMRMFAAMEAAQMPVIIHTGDPRHEFSRPHQMKHVLEAFPELVCVCAHLGGWGEWGEAWRTLNSFQNVYVDTSSSLYALEKEEAVRIIRSYAPERVLFGTDYPMWDPQEEMLRFLALPLTDAEKERILDINAEGLLGPFS